MNTIDILKIYLVNWFENISLLKINYLANLAMLSLFVLYFFVNLNMSDKFFTFMISGKVVGTDYVLKLNDVYIISAVILGSLLAISTFNYLKNERNRNKIKLRIKEAAPLSLNVRITA
jgi:hypothetical protein